jgi:CRISPR-associated endonuclease Cas1
LDARCEPHPSIRYQQIFPQWQRREITESVISGRKSGAEMARLYNISAPTVSRTVAAHRAAAENGRCFGIRSVSSSNRNATHPVNALLNYGYGLLESRVRIAIAAVGLDADVGFMHVNKRGRGVAQRSPLTLDLMEPLRPVVDRAVLGFMFGKKTLHAQDFIIEYNGVCRLHPQFARIVVQKVDAVLGTQPLELAQHAAWWIGQQHVT